MGEMKILQKLVSEVNIGARIIGPPDVELHDVTHDSRQVAKGSLFACLSGAAFDGHDFADQAVEAGASALLVERRLDLDRSDLDVPQIMVANSRTAMGLLASEIHGQPSHLCDVVGITGTNGKTSVADLISRLFRSAGRTIEVVGTLSGARTTPESSDLQRMLASFLVDGADSVAMEVSSHALELGRVVGTRFAAAVFTNLGRDHLDFHPDMESYFQAKAKLFDPAFTSIAVINADDRYGSRLLQTLDHKSFDSVLSYSLNDVDDLTLNGTVTQFKWHGHEVRLQLPGLHNVSNALAAATLAESLGIEAALVAENLSIAEPVRGRFEVIKDDRPFKVVIDYAHTPDALTAVLVAAVNLSDSGRVLVVFGCAGDRDTDKRPEMARAAEAGAHLMIVTSDNPRSEDPNKILGEVIAGVDRPKEAIVEPDRRKAIMVAIGSAQPGDVVLIAGKGHETYQIIGDQTIDFDDRAVAREALEAMA